MPQLPGASMDVVHRLTTPTLKMMVMVVMTVRELKPRRLSGQMDSLHPTLVQQGIEIAIDRGQAQAGRFRLGLLQHLSRQQRSGSPLQGVFDGAALAGVSFHVRQYK